MKDIKLKQSKTNKKAWYVYTATSELGPFMLPLEMEQMMEAVKAAVQEQSK